MLFLFVIDVSVMPNFALNNFYPSLLSMCFFIYCLINEKYEIMFLSLFVGFMQEIFFHKIFGINIFLNLCIGLIISKVVKKFSFKSHVAYIFLLTIALIARDFLIRLYMFIVFGINFNGLNLLGEFIYTFLLLVFVYPTFNVLFRSKLFKKTLEF